MVRYFLKVVSLKVFLLIKNKRRYQMDRYGRNLYEMLLYLYYEFERISFIIDWVINHWKSIVISPNRAPIFLIFGVWHLTGLRLPVWNLSSYFSCSGRYLDIFHLEEEIICYGLNTFWKILEMKLIVKIEDETKQPFFFSSVFFLKLGDDWLTEYEEIELSDPSFV